MPSITFEGLTQSLSRLPQVVQSIPDVLREPAANPLQAAILLGMAVVLVLVVFVTVVLLFMKPPEPAEEDEYEGEGGEGEVAEPQLAAMSWFTVTSIIILVVAAVWVTAGITTASPEVCTSCHTDTKHTAAKVGDPHKSVACTECHESGGPIARATVNLATRIQHVAFARTQSGLTSTFGMPASSDACARCHHDAITGVFHDRTLGLRVSHKEALDAGAACVDCHTLATGVVGATTVGMTPCLRCHDGKTAKADCSECHDGDPSQAIRPTTLPGAMASVQVPNPQCGSCHKDQTRCFACHGVDMPHSTAFKMFTHALPASRNIWNGKLSVCTKCHYPGHNNCQQTGCHIGPFPSHPSPDWRRLHANATWSHSDLNCGCHRWNPWDHNGVTFCEICHEVKPANVNP